MPIRLFKTGFAASLLALMLYAVPALASDPNDILTVSLNNDIRSTSPGVNRDANTDTVMMHIVEGLVGYRENGLPAPLLASAVDVSEDGLRYTFTLRRDVHFHNDVALTSADVVWTWQRYLDPATNWTCLSEFDGSRGTRIESIKAIDNHTVVFTLNRPDAMLLTQMAALPCGGSGIIHHSSVSEDGRWDKPVGTGPYALTEWRRGQFIDMTAFARYASLPGPTDGYVGGKKPRNHRVRWQIIRDDASRRAALTKGQLDIMPEVIASDVDTLRALKNVNLLSSPGMGTSALLIQSNDPLLSDVRLRRALAYSIDTRIVAELSTGGTAVANASMVPAASPWYSEAQKQGYPTDLDKARELLAEAGYKGEPIVLLTNRRYPEMYAQALMIHSMAREAGINIELQILEWATQLDRYQNGNFQLMTFGYTTRVDPFLGYDSVLGDREKNKRKVWGNTVAMALQRTSANTADPVERQALFDQLHTLMIDDVPLIMLCNAADVNAVNRSLEGFTSWPIGRARMWNVRRITADAPSDTLH